MTRRGGADPAIGKEEVVSCTKHFLGLEWEHHDWRRNASWADTYSHADTDMWGRTFTHAHVVCQPEYRCAECGAERAGACCGCDAERAAVCPRRGLDRVSA